MSSQAAVAANVHQKHATQFAVLGWCGGGANQNAANCVERALFVEPNSASTAPLQMM